MPGVCAICSHDKRSEIDRAIVGRESKRRIASHYGMSEASVRRHADNHLPELLVRSDAAREVAQADALLEQLNVIQGANFRTLRNSEDKEDPAMLLKASREARATTETLGKVLGEISDAPTINVVSSAEWITLRGAILDALRPYPDAKQAVLEAVRHVSGA